MRILILTQYYPPEMGAPQNRLSDLARRLMKLGHTVIVLTALPNYPTGEIFAGYRGCMVLEEWVEGIKIIRTWVYVTKSKSFTRRLLNYFSFVFSSLTLGVWKVGRQDILIVESPPLFLGLSGFFMSRLKKAKLVFNISDLWPESAVAMGILRNKTLIGLSTWLEEFLYRRSHLITGQTQGIIDNIQSRFTSKPVSLITNGVNVEVFVPAAQTDQRDKVRKEFGIERKFVVGYAGLHGLAQGLETVLQAARILVEQQDLFFTFFGDGPEKERLLQVADQLQVPNVRFYPTQPTSLMPAVTASFDIALVPLRRLDLFKGALPSKMFEAMAAAVPLIVSVDGEARTLIDKAQAGIFVQPENPGAMADAILQLYKNPVRRKTLGRNGQLYVIEHYDRRRIAEKFEHLLLDLHDFEGDGVAREGRSYFGRILRYWGSSH
jgi:glycosyltransferase involved in cell wall biosynthesis